MTLTHTNGRYVFSSTKSEYLRLSAANQGPKVAGFRYDPATFSWWTDQAERASKLAAYADEGCKTALLAIAQKRETALEASRATDAQVDIPVPAGLAYLPYQKAGIAYGLSHNDVLIGDEMGLGKTIQALGIINADASIRRVLIIVPASLKLNWEREARKWLTRPMSVGIANGEFPVTDVVIVNYDVLKKWSEGIKSITWDMLVVDEAHRLKNPKAIRTAQVYGKWDRDPSKVISPIAACRLRDESVSLLLPDKLREGSKRPPHPPGSPVQPAGSPLVR